MAAAGLTVVATAFVGGLALLAHWGKKNRSAEVSLIVLLLFLSLLVAAFGALAGIGLLLTSFGEGESLISSTWLPIAAAGIAAILASMIGLALCVPPLLKVTGRRESGFWSDPTIFFALWVFVLVLANNVVNLLVFTWSPDAAQFVPTGEGRASPGLILLSELPLFIVAVLGVGIGIRRSPREVLARLGYGPVSLPQLGLAALLVAGALLLSFAADVLFAYIQPDLYEQVGKVTDRLFDPRGLSPGYMVLFALLIGAGAAAGEETLFRGALQPVLGIPLTSILFASLHTQYGLSIGLGYVLLLSVGLGLLRKWANTTLSFLAHTVYNFWLVALSYFFST